MAHRPRKAALKIGVLGGAFDPPHWGHVLSAEQTLRDFRLDQVLLIPYCGSPHPIKQPEAPARDRLEMLRRAVRGRMGLKASNIEIRRGGVSYTADTLRALSRSHPGSDFYLIMGRDAFAKLAAWKDYPELFAMAHVIVNDRPGWGNTDLRRDIPLDLAGRFCYSKVKSCLWDAHQGRGIYHHPIAEIPASSREIREQIRNGTLARGALPPGVEEYIRRKGLYRIEEA